MKSKLSTVLKFSFILTIAFNSLAWFSIQNVKAINYSVSSDTCIGNTAKADGGCLNFTVIDSIATLPVGDLVTIESSVVFGRDGKFYNLLRDIDLGTNQIKIYANDGSLETTVDVNDNSVFGQMVVGQDNNLYLVKFESNPPNNPKTIYNVNTGTGDLSVVASLNSTPQIWENSTFEVDSSGVIWISPDWGNTTGPHSGVYKVSGGTLTTYTIASAETVIDLTLDSNGNAYAIYTKIGDSNTYYTKRISPSGMQIDYASQSKPNTAQGYILDISPGGNLLLNCFVSGDSFFDEYSIFDGVDRNIYNTTSYFSSNFPSSGLSIAKIDLEGNIYSFIRSFNGEDPAIRLVRISKDGKIKVLDTINDGTISSVEAVDNTGSVYTLNKDTGAINKVTFQVPDPPTTNFTSDVSTDLEAPVTVQFTDTSTNQPAVWSWDFGDGTISNLQNPTKTYDYMGNFTVSLTTNNLGGSDNETKTDYITVTKGFSQWEKSGTSVKPIAFGETTNKVFVATTGSDGYVRIRPFDKTSSTWGSWVKLDQADLQVGIVGIGSKLFVSFIKNGAVTIKKYDEGLTTNTHEDVLTGLSSILTVEMENVNGKLFTVTTDTNRLTTIRILDTNLDLLAVPILSGSSVLKVDLETSGTKVFMATVASDGYLRVRVLNEDGTVANDWIKSGASTVPVTMESLNGKVFIATVAADKFLRVRVLNEDATVFSDWVKSGSSLKKVGIAEVNSKIFISTVAADTFVRVRVLNEDNSVYKDWSKSGKSTEGVEVEGTSDKMFQGTLGADTYLRTRYFLIP